jgi:uncharacterized protein (TIGR02118 family)
VLPRRWKRRGRGRSWPTASIRSPCPSRFANFAGKRASEDCSPIIRLSVFYPATEGATFDHDYYREKHVPLATRSWGLDGAEIDRGVDGPYVAAVHFKFESKDAMNAAMASEGTGAVMADLANYTTIMPVMQISEIVD